MRRLGVGRASIVFAMLTVSGLALAAGGCGEEPSPAASVVRPVEIFEVGDPNAGTAREFPGEISAAQNADVAFEVPGELVEFPVKESEHVEVGQVLAKLDPRDYRAELEAAAARTASSKADLSRYLVVAPVLFFVFHRGETAPTGAVPAED